MLVIARNPLVLPIFTNSKMHGSRRESAVVALDRNPLDRNLETIFAARAVHNFLGGLGFEAFEATTPDAV
jgi:hypothetical protein